MTSDLPARLREALVTSGFTYAAVADLLGPRAHEALGRNETTPALRRTTGGSPLETLIRLFLLQRPVPLDAAERALPGLVDRMAAEGILERSVGEVAARLDCRPYAADDTELWVVSDLTPGLDGGPQLVGPDHVLGISAASTSLAQLTIREPVGAALDLGTGCGVQALHLAGHAARVVATDVNRRALDIARFNAALNELDAIEVREGSYFEPVAGERYDLIATNPPFVISPGTGERLVYRDSGMPGDRVVEHIVREAPGHLAEGGWCQVLANWAIEAGRPWDERLATWLDPDCDALVVQREVVDPAAYVELWLKDSGHHGAEDYLARYDTWLAWFEEQGIEGIGFGWVNLRRAPTSSTGGRHAPTARLALRRRAADRPGDRGVGHDRRPRRRPRHEVAGPARPAPGDRRPGRRRAPGDDRAPPAARLPQGPDGRHRGGRPGRRLRRRADRRADPRRARRPARPGPEESRTTYLPVVRELVEEGFLLPAQPA